MSGWLYHWLWLDLWVPIWPNLAASVLWATPALLWHHRRMKRHVSRELDRLRSGGDQ